jgi:hypothetical protein
MNSLYVGVDIGRSVDPTAIVVEMVYRPEDVTQPKLWLPLRHRILWIQRVPLGRPWQEIVEAIAVTAEGAAALGPTMIAVDATGLGGPVVEMLLKRCSVSLRAITLTGGTKVVQEGYEMSVPKRDVVTAVECVVQARRHECVPDCPSQQDLITELKSFNYSLAGGHLTYEARQGHDDLVMAWALALWLAERYEGGASAAWHQAARTQLSRTPMQQRWAEEAAMERLRGYQQAARSRPHMGG